MGVSASDGEDASHLELMEKNEQYFLQQGLKGLFADRPQVYNDVIKCLHIYTLVFGSVNLVYRE